MPHCGCCNYQIRQGNRLLIRPFSQSRDMMRSLHIHDQNAIAKVCEDGRNEARDCISSLGLPFAAELQSARIHFSDRHHRQKQMGAIAIELGNQIGRTRMSTRVEHGKDVGVETVHELGPVSFDVSTERTVFPRPIADLLVGVPPYGKARQERAERRRGPCSGQPFGLRHNHHGLFAAARDTLWLTRESALD